MPDIEEQLRKAFAEGMFDDLPGKGKPLNLEDNPHVNPEWRMTYHILSSSGYTLSWIQKRKEILTSLDQARADLSRTWNRCRDHAKAGLEPVQTEQELHWAQESFRLKISAINRQISGLNLEIPSAQLHLRIVNAQQEIDQLG